MAICALTLVVRLPLFRQRRSWWEMNVTGRMTGGMIFLSVADGQTGGLPDMSCRDTCSKH